MEGPKVTEEIRRSDGDPTRSEILEYRPVSWSRLSIAASDTTSARDRDATEDGIVGLVTCKSRQGLVRERREWMT